MPISKQTRDTVLFVLAVGTPVVAALWTAFVYFNSSKLPEIAETYSLCVGEDKAYCSNTDWSACGTSPVSWAKTTHPNECVRVETRMILDLAGDACGYKTFEIQCKR